MTTAIVGCGYLGLRVAKRLLARDAGARVLATTTREARFPEIEAVGATPILANLLDADGLSPLLASERIVYCVGHRRGSPISSRELHVGGMSRFVEFLAREGWRGRVVHVSTTSVYGQQDGSWVDEDSPAEPKSESGRIAKETEAILARSAGAGLDPVSIRMAGLYGPGRVIGRASLERGEPIPGRPDRWLNLIRIEDAAALVVAALHAPRPAPLYVAADDRPVLRGEYYARLASLLGAESPRFVGEDGLDDSNKRVKNQRIKSNFGLDLDYPSSDLGLNALIGA